MYPANDNNILDKAMMDWQMLGERQQYDALNWCDKLDCCDPLRLSIWQAQNGKTIPTYFEARYGGLLLTPLEIERAKQIEQLLITRGKA